MTRSTTRLSIVASLLLATAGCSGSNSHAQSGCSVATLRGTYIYAQDGFTIAGDTAAQRTPFAQAGRERFNGDGTMSGVATANFSGTVVRVTYAGTYTVQADCTGAVTFTDGDGVASHYDIAVEDGGAELGFVQTDANVVTAAFERRRTAAQGACSPTTLKGNYVYAGDGFDIPGDGSAQRTPFATAGREVYSGDGAISGIDTTSTNGVAAHTTYTSTYTIGSDCSATYTYDNDPTNPYELFVDPSGAEFAYVATGEKRVAAGYERRR
jgi:hypothetical protein